MVKVGSSSLTRRGRLEPARLDALVDALAARRPAGQQVVLVSSGAIAAGIGPLGLTARPRDLATQQAAASVGQLLLAERYAASFARYGLTVGQVLLTADDLHRRGHYRNAVRTLERLLALGVIPIVNENDTVATQEIRFGDNDRLAALVAHLVHADALVLLSDIDGLYTADPARARRAALVGRGRLGRPTWSRSGWPVPARRSAPVAWPPRSTRPRSPPAPASRCCWRPPTGSARRWPAVGGSYFAPTGRRTASRLFWLRHATTPRGRLVLDAGAVKPRC